MDSSVKKMLLGMLVVIIIAIAVFNVKPLIIKSFDLNKIKIPDYITVNRIVIKDKQVLEEIYSQIRKGSLREEKVKVELPNWGGRLRVEASYNERRDESIINSYIDGHIYNFEVNEKNIVSFEFYIDDKLSYKKYRVAYIKTDKVYQVLKKYIQRK